MIENEFFLVTLLYNSNMAMSEYVLKGINLKNKIMSLYLILTRWHSLVLHRLIFIKKRKDLFNVL